MGKRYDAIDDRLTTFIESQRLFFVATAPGEGGHVNCSPKGLDSFAILGPTEVAYLDLVGSGAETIAHLRDDGRITFLFCAFEGPPLLVRLQGRGEVVEPDDPRWAELAKHFPAHEGTRCIIRAQLDRISDSCGYGVPNYRYEGERDQLPKWADRKGPEGLRRYQLDHNRESIDGLPALRGAHLERSEP